MNRNTVGKVYINPNFKKNNVQPMLSASVIYTSFYENTIFPNQEMNNYHKNGSRKIYLNPNFKHVKESKDLPVLGINQKVTNTEIYSAQSSNYNNYYDVYKLPNDELENEKNYVRTVSHSYTENAVNEIQCFTDHQNSITPKVIKSNVTDIPFVKSRYCLVRNNKSPKNIVKTKPKLQSISINRTVENVPVNSNFATNFLTKPIQNENGSNQSKPIEKITKIKLSKYKTVPISYLKKNHLAVNLRKNYDDIHKASVKEIKRNNMQNFSISDKINNSRFKLTRSRLQKVELNETKITPNKINHQTNKKCGWQHQNKIKLKQENFKLNNIPCRLFRKYGKCLRKDYGKCEYLHDKKHVSLCRKFIKGICHDSNCTLSHELSSNKMPTCYFYLKGMCIKENCPYLHIKLNEEIKICQNFLKGYCESGDQCTFRHVRVKHTKKANKLNLTNTSKYSQTKITKLKKGQSKNVLNKKKIPQKDNVIAQDNEDHVDYRYYDDKCDDNICENIKPTRCKLGTLPSFIQL